MFSEIKVPELPEDITSGEISRVYVNQGQYVQLDDILFDVETEKVVLEIPSPVNGFVSELIVSEGEVVNSNQTVMFVKAAEDTPSTENPIKTDLEEETKDYAVISSAGIQHIEEVASNSLFGMRGILCGFIGLIVGAVVGVLGALIWLTP